MDKRRVTTAVAKYVVNPIGKRLAGRVGWLALLETTGRKSGQLRYNPVANGLEGDTFWIVSEHGSEANYVKNLTAHPRVRVKVRGRWLEGTATPLPQDDAEARLRTQNRLNRTMVGLVGTAPMTVRIDLDP